MIGVISNLCIPTLNVLLYGNQSLSFDVNKLIFLAIQNYIMRSKRFQVLPAMIVWNHPFLCVQKPKPVRSLRSLYVTVD